MSLATRITLLVVALLAISSLVAGVAFHRVFRRSLEAQLQGKLDARLAWLAAAIDVDTDDGEVQLEPGAEPTDAAESWSVATTDGKTLWSSPTVLRGNVLPRTRVTTHGEPHWPLAASTDLTPDRGPRAAAGGAQNKPWEEIPLADVPQPAIHAAQQAVPNFTPQSARRRVRLKKGEAEGERQFNIHGSTADREYEIRVAGSGEVLRVNDRTADPFAEYEIPEQHRLDLVVTAATSLDAVQRELNRLARVLWTVGPLVLLATGAMLALLLRWQFRPLRRIATEAAVIGPNQPDRRIAHVGSTSELLRLRESINAMLARLSEALDRERRFASTAAHELRTPLAQMKTALEVALRKPRDAAEYRQILADVAIDVDRLQKLILGLLHLTRTAEDAAKLARPLPLLPLLNKATETCGGAAPPSQPAQDNLWINADPELLLAALRNVLENARRYAPAEPATITVTSRNGSVEIIISDRGPGVPEHERERIFRPLTRLDAARSVRDDTDGFGLGLATARSTLRAFGGDLIARPRADGLPGAEFVFTLPLTQPPAKD